MNSDIIDRLLAALLSGGCLSSSEVKKATQLMTDAIADTLLCSCVT